MTMQKSPKNEGEKPISIAMVTGVLALLAALVTAYFAYKTQISTLIIPIYITQTAESRLETRTAGQVTSTSTMSFPTETLAVLPPTEIVVNTDTPPVPTLPPVTVVPSLCCLDGWDIFSSDGASFAPSPVGGCSNIGVDGLGIYASGCNLIFAKDDINQSGIYGLSMPIPRNVTIQVSVSISNLIEGEFWIGFSNGIDPQSGSLIYAMTPDPGGVSVYLNNISSINARYPWADMGKDIGWARGQPRRYNFTIKLDGNKVSALVNSTSFAPVTALSTNRLFLGFHSKPRQIGTYVNATISWLKITNNP
jgi:hypothetical protein